MVKGHFAAYRILNDPKDGPGPIKKGHNFIEEDPFLTNVRWGAFTGFKIGAVVAANDIINVHSIMGTRARYLYMFSYLKYVIEYYFSRM